MEFSFLKKSKYPGCSGVCADGVRWPGITIEKKKGSKMKRKACLVNTFGIA
jgi:hypothetical protein